MSNDSSTPPADPPTQQATDGQSTQAPPSEPVSPPPEPVSEAPAEPPPQAEAVPAQEPQPEVTADAPALEPEQTPTQTQTPAPSSVQDYGRAQPAEVSEPVSESTPEPSPSAQGSGGTQQAQPEPTPQPQSTANTTIRPHGDLATANAKIQEAKRKKLDKIMAVLEGKGPPTLKLRRVNAITNDEVEKLLRVSDATATRYLDILEKEGRVRQEGKTGKYVVYVRV